MLTREQLALIPNRLLAGRDTTRLLQWLYARGWRMSLYDLDAERRRRGITPVADTQPRRTA